MKTLFTLLITFGFLLNSSAQVVEPYGGGKVSDTPVMDKVDIKQIGRLIHTASVEEGNVVVRRFYRGKWEQIDTTPLSGIKKLETIELFAYRAVPYLFCQYDGKMSVIRAIADKWEYVGEETFGEGMIKNPDFSVIGERPFIVYEDADYEMIRMISLLDDSWYDVDVVESPGIKSYHLAAQARGDIFFAFFDEEGLHVKEIDQEQEFGSWKDLTKTFPLKGVAKVDDFEFIENKAYATYRNEKGALTIISLADLAKKWETEQEAKDLIEFGTTNFNLNISEYYFYTALNDAGIPQFLKNNKKGNWGDVTDLSTKKAKSIASDRYKNIIYVAYVDSASSILMVKKIEKGLNDEEEAKKSEKSEKSKKKK